MTAAADRAKAAELAGEHQHWCHWEGHGECCAADGGIPEDDYCDCGVGERRKAIAAALAEARAAGDRLTADLRALAEELDRPVDYPVTHYRDGLRDAAREFLGLVAAAEGAKA